MRLQQSVSFDSLALLWTSKLPLTVELVFVYGFHDIINMSTLCSLRVIMYKDVRSRLRSLGCTVDTRYMHTFVYNVAMFVTFICVIGTFARGPKIR